MMSRLLAFSAVSLVVAIVPGPDFALVTRNALAHGRRGVLLTTSGLTCALAVWVVVTALGLAAVLESSAVLFSAVKLAGAAYLAFLGIRALLASRHEPEPLLDGRPRAARTSAALWRQGLLSALLNPKLGVFFVTFFPQFVDRSGAVLAQFLVLGALFIVIGISWMTLYGLAVSRLGALLMSARVRRWMDRVTGTVLLGFGARLAIDRG